MNQVYTLEQLGLKNRTQLWDICRTNGIKCYPKTTDCVKAIYFAQESVVHAAVTGAAPEQPKTTCATCPLFKPFNDGTQRGLCCGVADSSLVVREHHTLTQDCQNLIDEQAVISLVEQPQEQTQIPGYDFCLSQGIEFKQRVGSETGTTYWYAEANHYYNQPGRCYKTTSFPVLENAVKAAVDYLGKCGVDVAEVKQQLIDFSRADFKIGFQFKYDGNKLQVISSRDRHEDLICEIIESPWGSEGQKRLISSNWLSKMLRDGEVKYPVDKETLLSDGVHQSVQEEQTVAQTELNEYIEAQAQTVAPEIEVDSDADADFGTLYRVWYSYYLLGSFYQSADGKWIAQSCDSEDRPRCNTAAEAQLLIVAMAGLLVADSPSDALETDLDSLLDKPFDELTADDWERLKQLENLEPIAA